MVKLSTSLKVPARILKTFLRADNKCGANCVQLDIKFKIDFKSSGVIENEHKAVKILTTFKITFFSFKLFQRINARGRPGARFLELETILIHEA